MKSLIFQVLVLFLFCNASLSALDIKRSSQKVETFLSAQGFFQNSVNAITSDRYGFLWIATPNGLVKYDGNDFEYYYHSDNNPSSIPDNFVSHLLKDNDGNIWLNTRQGMSFYQSDKEVFSTINCDIKNIRFIKADTQKRIWVAEGAKLHILTSELGEDCPVKEVALIDLEKKINPNAILDIEFVSEDELLVVTSTNIYTLNLAHIDGEVPTLTPLEFDNNSANLLKIIIKGSAIWIGTQDGLFQTIREGNKLTTIKHFFNSEDDDMSIFVMSMFIDAEDNLWIGTRRHGILVYNDNTFSQFDYQPKNKDGLTSNRINCFFEDDFGIMWVGTAQGGINKIDKAKKNFYNYSHNPYDEKSLSSNLVTDIAEDDKGYIWVSFFNNIVCKTIKPFDISDANDIQFKHFDKALGTIRDKLIISLYQDSKSNWWIAAEDGIYLYNEGTNNLKRLSFVLQGKDVSITSCNVIKENELGQIVLGGYKLYVLDDPWSAIQRNKPIVVNESTFDIGNGNRIFSYVVDSFENHWLATQKGIFQLAYKDGIWIEKNHFTLKNDDKSLKLSHQYVFSLHIGSENNVWMGTFGGGLMTVLLDSNGEPYEIKSYHKENGLPDEVIYGILEDDSGDLWLSTDMGIARFNRNTSQFETYNTNDGILNNNFRQSAFLKTKSGIMLMGGSNGLTIFDPKQITKNETPPKILISRLNINEKNVLAGRSLDGRVILEEAISDTKRLRLHHKHRNISLELLVQHSATPQKNKLYYMLEGVNSEWIVREGSKATATYTNLGAGTYRFLYKGANGDGVWSAAVGELEIKVLAPWYKRWWSIAIWSLLLMALGYFTFVYVLQLAKLKQQLDFERLDKERENEMHQAKIRFFTNISHDIKTPLSLIIGPLEKMQEGSFKTEDKKYFSIIRNNIARLQRLIDQLTSYRKAETGHLDLEYSKISLGNFIYPLLEAFEDYAQRAHVNFFHKVNLPNELVVIDIDKTERIILNLFFNAIKYSDFDAEIRIETGYDQEKETLYFVIADNGIGIPPEKIDKVFDRFYRAVDDRENWSGSGIGLALCKSLIDLMKGNISVENSAENLTVFKFEIPVSEPVGFVNKEDKSVSRNVVQDWMPPEVVCTDGTDPLSNLPAILIVDDEEEMRTFLYESFKNQYSVILAINGQDALDKMENYHPKLIISDVMMPKMDGYQLCEKIKSDMKTCHIPVILLTALGEDDHEIKGLEFGADVYIRKPFSIKHLEVTVRKLVENRQNIFNYFSQNSIITTTDNLEISDKERKFLEELTVLIEAEMKDSDFGVEELAKASGMSTSSFYRKLKKLTGQAPSAYLRNFRLQKAADLLKKDQDLNVTEVMFEIGIESASYFSSSFKKFYDLTPSDYIKKIRKN